MIGQASLKTKGGSKANLRGSSAWRKQELTAAVGRDKVEWPEARKSTS